MRHRNQYQIINIDVFIETFLLTSFICIVTVFSINITIIYKVHMF